ncbi:uncharacterized protein K02A2.6-like [Silurus meridionalis]|uniref:uncharacterized protein K02A2.6-like n=1 Tax=Silurus meridionalis TaxID=175797 RepID=UPI001EEC0B5A|nr:uncharacterized protein K02A2.6-like [Silurus meridionalis]XP_046719165.1 uncharacterized protein K02A2.6-like [Silurus meridionalis]
MYRFVRVAVRPSLPVTGVDFIRGNDLAGGKVMPVLEVVDKPDIFCQSEDVTNSDVFPACAVTRAQSRKMGDVVDLSDSFILPLFSDGKPENSDVSEEHKDNLKSSKVAVSDVGLSKLSISREEIIASQKKDKSLVLNFNSVVSSDVIKDQKVAYVIDNGMLMRKWSSKTDMDLDWNTVYQIVVPSPYRQHVLFLAYDHPLAGHLGVTMMYKRVLKHFFWRGLKKDVASYCRACHDCQLAGKPNQVIPSAPLVPIPAIGEPFEHVVVDCVGPLPKTKSGNQYLLTIMCIATRFAEAIPLRKITAPVII